VIAYDVSDDRRRNRLARLLLDYGDRVQGSVFEADLSSDEVERILSRAAELVESAESLKVYVLCADCADRVRSLGRDWPLGGDDLVLV